jgi:NAD(P)H-dependent FMN reductase
MPKLTVIVGSVREERAGPAVAQWFMERVRQHGKFEPELVDLKDVNLPLLNEPKHPRLQQYKYEHTKAWSRIVNQADAFVFVTPEYNYGLPPALVNAFDYVYVEWNYKAAGFVSYGGVSGGSRSVQMSKQIVTTLRVMPIPEAVTIPFIAKLVEGGVFKGGDTQDKAATLMLDELLRWTDALKVLRATS